MILIPGVKKLDILNSEKTVCAVRPYEKEIDKRIKGALDMLPTSADGAKININIFDGEGEAYSVRIDGAVTVCAESLRAAFMAVQTLRQIFSQGPAPYLYIEDAPDFRYRGFYHDISRGKIPTVDTMKKLIDTMAYYKLNSLQLYVEHTYPFAETANINEQKGYITPEELCELDDYCYQNFIEFIPSLSTFGHMYEILKQEKYSHLKMCQESIQEGICFYPRMTHHTVNPTLEESEALVKSLIDQYAKNFSSDTFNICCDETFDLNKYNTSDTPSSELYAQFVNKIISHVRAKGKSVMMWADIALEMPEIIDMIPEDTVFLNWGYSPEPKEEKIQKLASLGRRQIVCPGTSSWSFFCERPAVSEPNIVKMSEYAKKYGAEGVLNTNWGDIANTCTLPLSMCGLIIGAARSWNADTPIDEAFYNGVNALQYGGEDGVGIIREIGALQNVFLWNTFARACHRALSNAAFGEPVPTRDELKAAAIGALELADKIRKELSTSAFKTDAILACESIAVVNQLFIKYIGAEPISLIDTQAWFDRFSVRWLEDNKATELAEIKKIFDFYENL